MKSILAISTEMTAMPEKPRRPAIIARIKNVRTQDNIVISSFGYNFILTLNWLIFFQFYSFYFKNIEYFPNVKQRFRQTLLDEAYNI